MAKKSVSEKKAELLAELKKLEVQEKELEQNKFAIIGRVVMDEMTENSEFQETIETLLENALSKNTEREIFGLSKIETNRGRPKLEETT